MKKIMLFIIIAALLTACASKSNKTEDLQMVRQMTIDSVNAANVKQQTIDSMNRVNGKHVEKSTQNSTPTTTTTTTTTTTKKKKGWSSTAKGAVIGAGVGAIAGAVIDKKHPGQGAVIGGVLGAGAG